MSYSKPSRSAPLLMSRRLDLQRAHDLGEDRHAARENRRAIRAEPGQDEIFDAPRLDQLLDDGLDGREA